MPAPVARICQSTGSHQVTPRTNSAPRSAPGTEPRPPMTTIVNTTRLSPARVRVELEAVLLVHEERARERGEETRDRERAAASWCVGSRRTRSRPARSRGSR